VLAAGCGLGYGEWAAAQYRFDLSGPTPKMAVLVYGPALTAAGCLVEVAYLVWARASAAPAEPGVTPDPRAGDDG
jgi:hypothetical protein